MNNDFLNKFSSKVKLKVTGKSVKRFINKLVFQKIELLNIKYISKDQAIILIYKNDYLEVLKQKSIYDLEVVDSFGYIKIRKMIKVDTYLFIFLLFGIIGLYVLSNVIFNVEIIHSDKYLINLIRKELRHYDIEPYRFVKSFSEIEKIKNEILSKYKDKLEWMEIERVGTKYVVRFEERIINEYDKNTQIRHVVSSKNAIIKKVIAKKGVILKPKNSYVKKGDIVISGDIFLNDEIKNHVRADGTIYGEVWYNVTTSFPYFYIDKKYTGKKQYLILFKIFDNYYGLNFKKYSNSVINDTTIINHNFLPISLVFQKSREVKDNSAILTVDEAEYYATLKSRKKIKEMLDDEEYIIYEKQLKKEVKDSKIVIEMFYAVYENITDYLEFDVGG